MTRDLDHEFRQEGYLSAASADMVPTIKADSQAWFDLAHRASREFQKIAIGATGGPQGNAGDPKVVTTLLALRCASTIQAALLLAERGMEMEVRTLARGLIENALCLGALHDAPEKFLELLWKDADASRRAQGNFILENNLVSGGEEQRAQLEAAIAQIEKVRQLNMKDVAELSPLRRLYLTYRVLSNDSAHPSARSLSRYLDSSPDRSSWTGFVVGPAQPGKLDDCLLLLMQGLTAAAVAITQILGDADGNSAIATLSEEMRALSPR